jgi:hypothetical protein
MECNIVYSRLSCRGVMTCLITLCCLFPLSIKAGDAQEIYRKAEPSVYTIYGVNETEKAPIKLGSAIAISENQLATNCHVTRESQQFLIQYHEIFIPAKLIFQNHLLDLCLLKVEKVNFLPVTLRDSKSVKVGEEVYAIGSPYGLDKSISEGIISNKHPFDNAFILQTDATIAYGSSGGGLFDRDGKLVGITRAGHKYKDIAFAVPAEWIQGLLAQKQDDATSLKGHTLNKLGEYGKNKISLFRLDKECFIYLISEVPNNAQPVALAWFPAHPLNIYLLPMSIMVERNLHAMIELGYFKEGRLIQHDQSSNIPELMMPSSVIVETFQNDPHAMFEKSATVQLSVPSFNQQSEITAMDFGVKGFSKAFEAYQSQCVQPSTLTSTTTGK